MKTVLVILCLVIGGARFFIPARPITWLGAYKDAAHLLVAFLLGGIVFTREPFYSYLFWGLTAVEVLCFGMTFFFRDRVGCRERV
jgi:hypothetical protein